LVARRMTPRTARFFALSLSLVRIRFSADLCCGMSSDPPSTVPRRVLFSARVASRLAGGIPARQRPSDSGEERDDRVSHVPGGLRRWLALPAAAFLLFLAFPPVGLSLLVFVGMIPLYWALFPAETVRSEAPPRSRLFRK